jgi:hypothetical protein
MPKSSSFLAPFSPKPLVKASRLRLGAFEARGVAAILCGAASIVLAAGVAGAMRRSAAPLPETLREAREFWLALRGPRPELANRARP